ncbi:hypothetical protein KSS87_023543 [Heliosperma pusillum]|nr:hypothetical protein KSS87_023543 [Heliosperma pusillum]
MSSFHQLLRKQLHLPQLKQIHAQILTQSLSFNPPLISCLIHSYLSSQNLNSATFLFDHYPSSSIPPTILWNLIIRAHSKTSNCYEPVKYLRRMLSIDRSFTVLPDDYTFTFVVTSCSRHGSCLYGELVHGLVVKFGFVTGLFVGNALVNMYSVFARPWDAQKVFDEMSDRDVFSWTSLLGGYAKHGCIDKARGIFERMPLRNDVSWVVMISGFVNAGRYIDALDYFDGMLGDGKVKPNEAAIVCALSSCANLGALDRGDLIHEYIERNRIPVSSNICTALVDMYAKCGRIDCARRVFDTMSKRDVHNYTSMISGLSIHGHGQDAMWVFSKMIAEGIEPNEITILGILNGCSHSGLVQEGTSIFNDMEKLWGIAPRVEHYGSYVDLLGRAGHLERAFDVVKTMPIEPDLVIWRSLLSACRTHRDVNVAERVMNHVRQLGSCGQILLSSLYAYMGNWESVGLMRKEMSPRRNTAELGCSWIELDGVTHEFRVDDQLHPQISEIRDKLKEILDKAKLEGYTTNTAQVTFDLSEEDKEQAVSLHSEKLAIAFALLSTKPGKLIRIVKNLRTCEDCHSAFKAISRVYDREIIVRDRSRFHTFKQGKCSCNDFCIIALLTNMFTSMRVGNLAYYTVANKALLAQLGPRCSQITRRDVVGPSHRSRLEHNTRHWNCNDDMNFNKVVPLLS